MTPQQPWDRSKQLQRGLLRPHLCSVLALPLTCCISHPFCPQWSIATKLVFFPSVPFHSPRALTPTSSRQRCPVVATGRAVIAHHNPFFPLPKGWAFYFCVSDVEKRTGWSLSMYLVSAACWKVTVKMKNERRKNFLKKNTELLKRQQGKLSPTPLWFFWVW